MEVDAVMVPRSAMEVPTAGRPDDSAVMLVLGASLNAMMATGEWLRLVSEPSEFWGRSGERSRLHAFLVLSSQLKEAIDQYWNSQPLIDACAMHKGATAATIGEVHRIADKSSGGVYSDVLLRWRHSVTFHWEPGLFRKWAVSQSSPEIEWVIWSDGKDGSSTYSASQRAVIDLVAPGATSVERQRSLDTHGTRVNEALLVLVPYFERAIAGFLEQHGAFGRRVQVPRPSG